MNIRFARITTEMGPFAFIRLPDSIDLDKCDVREWAARLSAQSFSGIGVAACNNSPTGERIIRGSAPKWETQAGQIPWKGMGMSSLSVEELPAPRDLRRETVGARG
jgi:hypothetical protein